MPAMNLSPHQACHGMWGQGGQGLFRRHSTLQSHPIPAPMGAASWPPLWLLQPELSSPLERGPSGQRGHHPAPGQLYLLSGLP